MRGRRTVSADTVSLHSLSLSPFMFSSLSYTLKVKSKKISHIRVQTAAVVIFPYNNNPVDQYSHLSLHAEIMLMATLKEDNINV